MMNSRFLLATTGMSLMMMSVAEGATWRYRRNTPPTITSEPATTVVAGSTYKFTPTASDSDGDRLRFYIAGKPAWATFNSGTGSLSGVPTAAQAATYPNISISVSDGKVSTRLPAFTLTVTAAGNGTDTVSATNHDPAISGTPSTGVVAGSPYAFQPSASDADGDVLSFSVSGKPAWATFSVSTGSLTGIPSTAQVGSYTNIVIHVSDGKNSKSLPPFSITVSAQSTSGSATLSWTAPTLNTDGSMLSNLSGYRIYHGTAASALSDVRTITANASSYQFASLPSGTHYFAISAYNTDGAESVLSTVGSKTIP